MEPDLDPRAAAVTAARHAGLLTGTFYGAHGSTKVVAISTHHGSDLLPYGWHCTCGIAQRLPSDADLFSSAWRHVHPPRWRSWARRMPLLGHRIQPTARVRHPRAA